MYRDSNSNKAVEESIRPQVATGDVNGESVDLQGSDSALIAISVGAITGAAGDAAVTLEESDQAGSGFTAVAAADILGDPATALAADTPAQFGYSGARRYIRAAFALGGETNVAIAVAIIRGHLHRAPSAS